MAFVRKAGFVCSLTFGLLLSGTKASEYAENQTYELVAVDQASNSVVLVDGRGTTRVFRLDEESEEGIRLRAVTPNTAIFDARDRKTGSVIGYRVVLGAQFEIRSTIRAARRAVQISQVATGSSSEAPADSTKAKD